MKAFEARALSQQGKFLSLSGVMILIKQACDLGLYSISIDKDRISRAVITVLEEECGYMIDSRSCNLHTISWAMTSMRAMIPVDKIIDWNRETKVQGLYSETMPPIWVKRVLNGRYRLLDGAARLVACINAGRTEILAHVKDE